METYYYRIQIRYDDSFAKLYGHELWRGAGYFCPREMKAPPSEIRCQLKDEHIFWFTEKGWKRWGKLLMIKISEHIIERRTDPTFIDYEICVIQACFIDLFWQDEHQVVGKVLAEPLFRTGSMYPTQKFLS